MGGRAFEIIAELVQADGELVSRADLSERVWRGVYVEESALRVHIAAIRKAFAWLFDFPSASSVFSVRGFLVSIVLMLTVLGLARAGFVAAVDGHRAAQNSARAGGRVARSSRARRSRSVPHRRGFEG